MVSPSLLLRRRHFRARRGRDVSASVRQRALVAWAISLPLFLTGLVGACGSQTTIPTAAPTGSTTARTAVAPSTAAPSAPSPATAPTTAAPETASESTSATSPDGGPCGTGARPPARYQHVVWVVMENHSADAALAGPYVASLAKQCAVASDYRAITHPSLPNYIAMTSGATQGITDDAAPDAHPLTAASIFSQAPSWRALQESMPSGCLRADSGLYAVKHNPAAYYRGLADCPRQDVPLVSPPDLSAAFTLITPNLCNDTHDCPTSTGDAWLAKLLPTLVATPEYRAGSTAIFVTWDEDDGSRDNRVALLAVARGVVPGTRAGARFDHYSLLRTTEDMLGLPALGGAASAAGMRSALGI